jgi:type III secretory pathway lipoprotein EscJ
MALLAIASATVACNGELVAHQQPEQEANKIVVLLLEAGIDDAKSVKDEASRELRFNVEVPHGERGHALKVLSQYNLPKPPADDTNAVFKEGGLIPTNEQLRAKREVGIRGDIINSLSSIPRVIDVKAEVSIPEDNPLRDVNEAKPRPKASVLLLYLEDGDKAPPIGVEDVQKYVQAALPEIKSNEVAVNMFVAGNIHGDKAGVGGGAALQINPEKGCVERERVIGIDVCSGNKSKVQQYMLYSVMSAGLLSGLVVISVLRAMKYRKDLTRLTAQFEKVKK